ncbi:hypothetical protein EVJ58_g4525 [Rhodofomes roseus]|uniref:DUF6534 domain-containing protein n=1 Tax=Rhodofomes roseus TaxID=34475 RepID=A0A4Y9YIY0_9APHY|nr:hypothetical protein EVJ58_g4525 [Rhodofomes roseus]
MAYYHYTVTNFGDYFALEKDYWALSVQLSVGDFLFNCNKRKKDPHTSCNLRIGAVTTSVLNSVHNRRVTIGCGLAANFACDLVIAAANIYYLNIRRTPSQRMDKAIKLLIAYTLNTCALATVFTLWLACPGLVDAALEFILAQLYPCTLLSLLNSRWSVRRALEGQTDMDAGKGEL